MVIRERRWRRILFPIFIRLATHIGQPVAQSYAVDALNHNGGRFVLYSAHKHFWFHSSRSQCGLDGIDLFFTIFILSILPIRGIVDELTRPCFSAVEYREITPVRQEKCVAIYVALGFIANIFEILQKVAPANFLANLTKNIKSIYGPSSCFKQRVTIIYFSYKACNSIFPFTHDFEPGQTTSRKTAWT